MISVLKQQLKQVLEKFIEKRTVRSFVRREGRITHSQQEALAEFSERFVLPHISSVRHRFQSRSHWFWRLDLVWGCR